MREVFYVENGRGRPCAVEVMESRVGVLVCSEHLSQAALERWAAARWPAGQVRAWDTGVNEAAVLVTEV